MEAKQLIDGQIYAVKATSYNDPYFFRCAHPNREIKYLFRGTFYNGSGNLDSRTNPGFPDNYRECTEDEKIIFEASEKAMNYIPLEQAKKMLIPKIVENYTLI